MEPLSDEELVARYRAQGDPAAAESILNELFQRYHGRVALWCYRLAGNRDAAADLAQDVFMKAFRYLDTYRGESKFSTWLYSIARNHCFNEIKARAARAEESEEVSGQLVDPAPDAHGQLERADSARIVREIMRESLTELESRVMTLHYGEDLPLETITRLLGLENTSGAKAYIVSAKRKLARAVERWKAQKLGSPL